MANAVTQDHVFLGNSWNVSANFTLDDLHRNATFTAEQLQLWMTNGSGLLGLPPTNQFMWLRTNESTFSALGVKDPSAGPTSAHFELIISVCAVLDVWGSTQLTTCFNTIGQLCVEACRTPLYRPLPLDRH